MAADSPNRKMRQTPFGLGVCTTKGLGLRAWAGGKKLNPKPGVLHQDRLPAYLPRKEERRRVTKAAHPETHLQQNQRQQHEPRRQKPEEPLIPSRNAGWSRDLGRRQPRYGVWLPLWRFAGPVFVFQRGTKLGVLPPEGKPAVGRKRAYLPGTTTRGGTPTPQERGFSPGGKRSWPPSCTGPTP